MTYARRSTARRSGARTVPAVLVAMVSAVALWGCSHRPDVPLEALSKPALAVRWTVDSQGVAFLPGTAKPAPGALAALDGFVARVRAGREARFALVADPSVPRPLSDARRRRLETRLRALGVAPGLSSAPAPAPPGRDGVLVLVGHYAVVMPACPDWRKPEIGDFTNTPSSNFGCASTRNLGAMVADPLDLVRPRTMGPADGERAARAVRRYRKGEQPPAEAPTSPVAAPLAVEGGT